MDQRMRFVSRYLEGGATMTALCEAFGISRECGYKWVRRYEELGVDGLKELSRAPRSHPNAVSEATVEQVLGLRRAHPTWGPRKLLHYLGQRHPRLQLPAASTVANWLKEQGLAVPRRKRYRAAGGAPSQLAAHVDANACWSTDFKGHFRTQDNRYCYPLTIQDVASRFLIRCQALAAPTELLARPVYEAAFREFGLPRAIRSDNGAPFAAPSFTGLSRLSAWWISLGVDIERIPPGQPQHNGRIERMHRTLKAEATEPPSSNLRAQQRRFNHFGVEFNEERPHQALGGSTPASRYVASARPFPRLSPEPEYPSDWQRRVVNANGCLTFDCHSLQIGAPLAGYALGLEPVDDGVWALHFFNVRLGEYDARDHTLACAGGVRTCGKRRY